IGMEAEHRHRSETAQRLQFRHECQLSLSDHSGTLSPQPSRDQLGRQPGSLASHSQKIGSTMANIVALTAANEKRWAAAKHTRDFSAVAKRLVAPAAKVRYQAVSAKTRVPWAVIAVIHERECSQNWGGSLAQGDPWNRVSVHVPAGRGPFRSWEAAAIDALVHCAPYAARNTDWSIGGGFCKL